MPFLDNKSRYSQNSDVGIKISKPFYDAGRTQPQNLIFSSSWPSLPIATEIKIPDATALATYTTVGSYYRIPHKLTYPPFTMYWQKADISGQAGMGNVYLRQIADVDRTYVYIKAPQTIEGAAGVTPPIDIKCFALDLSVDIDYLTPVGDNLQSGYDSNFGIKVSKPNKDISSKDLRDFILHSRAQSPLILAVKNESTVNSANTGVVQYTSKLPYPVWVYGFVRQFTAGGTPKTNSDFYGYSPYYAQAFPVTTTDGFVSYINFSSGANGATLVVLRDPMFASNPVTAQY